MSGFKNIVLAALALALVYPVTPVADDYVIQICVLTMIYMILAMGLNVIPGFTGLLDLGFVGFYGIGAYVSGILAYNYGVPFWLILPAAVAVGALFGVLRGGPTLRLSGDYFAIVTFGFTELVVLFVTNEIWLTRGPMGMPNIPPVTIGLKWLGIDWAYAFEGKTPYFYLGALLTAAVYLAMRRIEDSRLGRAWLAIREDPLAAASSGVNLMTHKTLAFAFSAAIGALAGCFMAPMSSFIHPDYFKFWESFLVLCMLVLGGLGNINGALAGAVVLVCLGEVLRVLLQKLGLPAEVRFLVYGLLMIVIMRVKPAGFLPHVAGQSSPSSRNRGIRARISA